MNGQQQAARNPLHKRKAARLGETLGNAVVDGILYGVLASLVMLALHVILGALAGFPVPALLARLGMPAANATPMHGVLGHLAMGIVYGMTWSVAIVLPLRRFSTREANWRLAGLAFGCAAWILTQIAIFVASGVSLLPWFALLMAYLGYGGTLGYLQSQQE